MSCLTVSDIVSLAAADGMNAVALTDVGNMGGALEFFQQCKQEGIKPIFGLQLRVDVAGVLDQILVLAENDQGYGNLLRLASMTSLPKLSDVAQFCPGLIGISGGMEGYVTALVGKNQIQEATSLFVRYQELFGEDSWYLQLNGGGCQQSINEQLVRCFPRANVLAAADVCSLDEQDDSTLKVLQCLRTGCDVKTIDVPTGQPWFTKMQMAKDFANIPVALENSKIIAERCVASPCTKRIPGIVSNVQDLQRAVSDGAKVRYPLQTATVQQRLSRELQVIEKLGFGDYFLLVADICRYAREEGIPLGPGRGSAAGSCVAYCLQITDVDPLQHDLLFERFLNEGRLSMPDIDLDLCYLRRHEVIAYLQKQYGTENVGHIGTYGTFGLRAAVRDLARIWPKPLSFDPDSILEGIRSSDADAMKTLSQRMRKVAPGFLLLVKRLVGKKRHFSTHASGVVVSPVPLNSLTSIEKGSDNLVVTHFSMESIEAVGLLKIDLLGLRTLTMLTAAEASVQNQQPQFCLAEVNPEDKKTAALLGQGKCIGVFQLEGSQFSQLLTRFQPQDLDEVAVLLALGRPGPLKYLPDFIRRKNGAKPVTIHAQLEPILASTYGFMVYQEQVMEIAHGIAGLSLTEADIFRKAMSKKDPTILQDLKQRFLDGCRSNGVNGDDALAIFSDIERFAGYAFNKAHSYAYGKISWQCAFLKANYPADFYAALINQMDFGKRQLYLQDAQLAGIAILAPDIRYSQVQTEREGEGLRIGLAYFGPVHPSTLAEFVQLREKAGAERAVELLGRLDLSDEFKKALIYAGALDGYGSRKVRLKKIGDQVESDLTILEREKEILGIYLSDHPALRWEKRLTLLKGSQELIAGSLGQFTDLEGVLISAQGPVDFRLKKCPFADMLEKDQLLGLFGSWQKNRFDADWILPLRPMVLVLPRRDQLVRLQPILDRPSKGSFRDTPVIIGLTEAIWQCVEPRFWSRNVQELCANLQQESIAYCWLDPWCERVEENH